MFGMSRTFFLFFVFAAFFTFASLAFAETPPPPRPTRLPTPLPGGDMFPAWMTPPAKGPTQADAGATLYYYHCMACHGDKGQGLTTEWRAQWDVEHQNCARSACHGPRHPPEGFSFPKNFAPGIVGLNTLGNYENAQALYDFVSTKMPYQAPGSLEEHEYWQLVAYLLRQRGVNVNVVNEGNAVTVPLNKPPESALPVLSVVVAGVAVLVLFAGVVVMRGRFKRRT